MEILAKKNYSDDLKTNGEDSNPIPLYVISEIFNGLRVKNLVRYFCVSKHWQSIIHSRDFVKSYLIKSSTRPQGLIFTFESKHYGKRFFFSASHPQNRGESSASIATYHMKCHYKPYTTTALSVHGLICYGPPSKLMVYNPSTRRSITLPKNDSQRIDIYHYLVYDPVGGDCKVLCLSVGMAMIRGYCLAQKIWVLKLGNGNSWRVIENFPPHYLGYPHSPDTCIDGVLYYGALLEVHEDLSHAVMRFDIRSESFDLIQLPVPYGAWRPNLTNYKGKLAIVFTCNITYETKINLWVLEDAAKHEWSKNVYILSITESYFFFRPFCANNAGEVVLAREKMIAKSLYVLYYDPQKNIVTRVNIEGISEPKLKLTRWDNGFHHDLISIFPGRVDNLMFL